MTEFVNGKAGPRRCEQRLRWRDGELLCYIACSNFTDEAKNFH